MARGNADPIAKEYYAYKKRQEQQRLTREGKQGSAVGGRADAPLNRYADPEREGLEQVWQADGVAQDQPLDVGESVSAPTDIAALNRGKDLPESEAFQWEEDAEEEDNTLLRAFDFLKKNAVKAGVRAAQASKNLLGRGKTGKNRVDYVEGEDDPEEFARARGGQAADAAADDDDIYEFVYVPNPTVTAAPSTEDDNSDRHAAFRRDSANRKADLDADDEPVDIVDIPRTEKKTPLDADSAPSDPPEAAKPGRAEPEDVEDAPSSIHRKNAPVKRRKVAEKAARKSAHDIDDHDSKDDSEEKYDFDFADPSGIMISPRARPQTAEKAPFSSDRPFGVAEPQPRAVEVPFEVTERPAQPDAPAGQDPGNLIAMIDQKWANKSKDEPPEAADGDSGGGDEVVPKPKARVSPFGWRGVAQRGETEKSALNRPRAKADDAEDDYVFDDIVTAPRAKQEGVSRMSEQRKKGSTPQRPTNDAPFLDADQPSLSRRERRALAEASENRAADQKELNLDARAAVFEDDPTVEFKPIRDAKDDGRSAPRANVRPTRQKPVFIDDDDEEDDDGMVRRPPAKLQKESKRRVYDDDDDYYEDDYDDEYESEYEEGSFGKRFLGFLKGLILIALLLLLAVLALRLTEANGAISLDGLRDSVGGYIPYVNEVFPAPPVKEESKHEEEPEPTPTPTDPDDQNGEDSDEPFGGGEDGDQGAGGGEDNVG